VYLSSPSLTAFSRPFRPFHSRYVAVRASLWGELLSSPAKVYSEVHRCKGTTENGHHSESVIRNQPCQLWSWAIAWVLLAVRFLLSTIQSENFSS
jgi:hypothetical protein